MKGLELSHQFFEKVGRPIIERVQPGVMQKISAGLVGECSDCYGFDDEVSRDHNWGPRFQVFLFEQNPELQKAIGNALELNLPKSFQGFSIAPWPPELGIKSFEVWFWPDFTDNLVGLRRRPVDPVAYAKVAEAQFYSLLSGEIFWDPEGNLMRAQMQWDHMPQEVWHWRLHWCLKDLLQRDDVLRAIGHGEADMAKIMVPRYIEWTIRLAFLTARKYSPPRKWLLRVLSKLTSVHDVYEAIVKSIRAEDAKESYDLLEKSIWLLREKMVTKGFLSSNIGISDQEGHADVFAISEYFLGLIRSDFRGQAARLCPLDLLGSLEQRPKFAP